MGDVHVDEPHRIANLLPDFEAFTDAHDRRQRLNFKMMSILRRLSCPRSERRGPDP